MNCARTFLKVWLWFLFVSLVMEYCMKLVYNYFQRAKTTWESLEMPTLPRSAAMETKLLGTWVWSCSIIYCVDGFIFKSDYGQGISFF